MLPKLSIVTTLYKSAPYLEEFYVRMTAVAKSITDNYNIIFVNDGSPDSSLEIVKDFLKNDSKIVIVDLSRNFGHHKAILAGLSHADGDYVFLIDCDLEEDPELLQVFWKEMLSDESLDSLCGVQEKRKGGIFEKISGGIFNKFINLLANIKIPENVVLVRLMTKRFVSNLLTHKEKDLVFVGLVGLTGFNQNTHEIQKKHKGASTYTLGKKIELAFNYITSLSSRPLVYIFYFGILITFTSALVLIYLLFAKLFNMAEVGWTSLIFSIWLVGGIIIFTLGIIGIYVSKIFIEVKNRPLVIIKELYKRDE